MQRAPRLQSCGCINVTGMTCQHQRARKAAIDQQRPSARIRGYDTRWDKARVGFLLSHPTCAMTNLQGQRCGKPAEVVDHVIPHRGDRVLFWTRTNWQPLCVHCHASRKQSMEARGESQTSAKGAGTAWGPQLGTHRNFSSRDREQKR